VSCGGHLGGSGLGVDAVAGGGADTDFVAGCGIVVVAGGGADTAVEAGCGIVVVLCPTVVTGKVVWAASGSRLNT
jgi:hypothetical protein